MVAFAGGISIPGWSRVYAGKVRDMYVPIDNQWHDGNDTMLVVASDRLSVQDRVVPSTIPGKGELLTQLTLHWFDELNGIVPNHLASVSVPEEVAGRAMIVRRLRMYPVECSVAGYMTDVMLADYRATGKVCGVELPAGLREGDQLPSPIFLPARKGSVESNDIDITFDEFAYIVGLDVARSIRSIAIRIYNEGHRKCAQAGIILAQCKVEFGSSADPGDVEIVLADEVLTPDSATMWLAQDYEPGKAQVAMGKQFIRHWLTRCGWDRDSGTPPPPLPPHLVATVKKRYETVFAMLAG
ncbi:phosphoribosylaminoimidazolesuccinocarboxamide synthase [Arcanobacterium phocisimile]|uniref:Phosphoribosylaminoimidazole-succinocarboxamide synthase n=1 Tax=Arcanobacterium phocisimile TaxID=1302235 RepID=A0ABX7IIL9_9ACTO|nr:phosphoribosylaminoimidazolesuccinocarboxamide synthase [Arcanobacterium phocisimile]QRV02379.1 phosphoribosylaminoimidazolesuccinocarboxamide synthase [Arcanobacterium phocisimile]